MDISNATERRHSPEIVTHAQKHKQRNLEKPATDVQDEPATHKHIKKDTVEISERARLAQQSQGLLKEAEPGPQTDNILAQFNEMLRAQKEERKQFLTAEAEANGDDFLKKIVNGDYGFSKDDNESLKTILSDEQYAKLEHMYEKKLVKWEQEFEFLNSEYSKPGSAQNFIFNALVGKVENALDIAVELGNMVFDSRLIFTGAATIEEDTSGVKWLKNGGTGIRLDLNPDAIIITDPKEFEAFAANREAGRDLAKYIAENYFDDPEEAQAFMDKINKYIKNSELRDQGYTVWFAEMDPVKPQPPNKLQRWFMEKGYSFVGPRDSSFEERLKEFGEEYEAYHKKYGNIPFKFQKEPFTWEEIKEMECDPRYSMYSEKNKAWYADFFKRVASAQDIINNAKLITDFSSNEKWNVVMNLLK
ncbi:MAG: hypothetical protein LBC87_00125 [Fibromonadaceae bacterium]|nr:hypothetical protein [Fibromonadaceae bacterium]